MGWLSNLWAQFRAPFTADDIMNAEDEDALRNVKAGEQAVTEARQNSKDSNERLRSVLRATRERTRTFKQFEERIRRNH